MKVRELINTLYDGRVYGVNNDQKMITHLTNDTRQVIQDSAFVAIRGERFDGHQAIEEVVDKGAILIVVEELPTQWQQFPVTFLLVQNTVRAQAILANQFYNEPSKQLRVVAVTGTNGKTTVSSMISDLLSILNHQTGVIGTLHYKVGDKIYPAVNTTPHSLALQGLFREMVEEKCDTAIIEASSHALEIGRLWFTDVDCAIFTNLTREHLDFHQTMERYAYAKRLLFAQLGQEFRHGRPKLAIINEDDPYASLMAQGTSASVLTFSRKNPQATIYCKNINHTVSGMYFDLVYQTKEYPVFLPMSGEYNLSNYMAAFLCLTNSYGYSPQEVLVATQSFTGVEGRMQTIQVGQPFEAIVDFAHTTDAVENVLKELSERKTNHLIVLFGHSGGNRDSGARPEFGDVLFRYADKIVFTADNPRNESLDKIWCEMIQNHDEKPYWTIEDRSEAIDYAVSIAEPEDIILFAGKGGEGVQIIGDTEYPYNEAQVVEQALQKYYSH